MIDVLHLIWLVEKMFNLPFRSERAAYLLTNFLFITYFLEQLIYNYNFDS